MENGLYAKIKTAKGDILLRLEDEKTPVTVANFVALAEGSMPNKAKKQGEPFYDGIKFHRVINDFMIQGGDPAGSGAGGPGYQFDDEIVAELRHDRPGILSMANAGAGTNGSQFFITHVPTPWLDGKHTIFGHVIEGQEVVNKITQGDKIDKVEIIRVGDKAKDFNAVEVFKKGDQLKAARASQAEKAAQAQLEELSKGFEKTASGLRYQITKEGNGEKPKAGQTVDVHYTGMLPDGRIFDSSYNRNQPISFPLGQSYVIAGWDEGIALLNKGAKATLILPPSLAYGEAGSGGVIPPNAILKFDVELVDFK